MGKKSVARDLKALVAYQRSMGQPGNQEVGFKTDDGMTYTIKVEGDVITAQREGGKGGLVTYTEKLK